MVACFVVCNRGNFHEGEDNPALLQITSAAAGRDAIGAVLKFHHY
jgi:hypothetical protein